ncbi:BlaI/MecI/CopY family transcriptional regulator [Blastococcus sp. CT_GayMR19]|uniref:BlaI/MecI/CopY family transcriptional regulator n=1 Tax=Blastococcus sp. CT_GayMR19 TaxID=2559608 RepID=UPI001073685E|nr:BlaI/MecI/CopY family transcriptional regulator [Blastococcus sp. CT_GayMR19]TFV79386.1 BlaI/MecI/CopY family transcriptional regulator [Blastococcus sp. CT_GayMR19]
MQPFGELEAAVMRCLWQRTEPTTVREVLVELTRSRPLAYTTVMTVMDNLHGKGHVQRHMHNRAWLYTPTRSSAEHRAALLQEILGEAGDRDAVLMHFVADLDPDSVATLKSAVEAARPPTNDQ